MNKAKENKGCLTCGSFQKIKESNRKYCCHNDAFRLRIDPISGKYQQLKNNDMHKHWNKKLKCKRYNKAVNEDKQNDKNN